ncbi:uncharacterized protein VTP21DRAFT_11158 [Calcarisporiella thermophila]|uniref:uncharacterized protein n=1 Tax=Calcarisporiella thermophila TaxID=911321 RepID=UPI0037425700
MAEELSQGIPLNPPKLWEPSSPDATNMRRFMDRVNEKHNLHLENYNQLFDWSVSNLSAFWSEVWTFTGIKYSVPYSKVIDESAPMDSLPEWFTGARLNFAENLLWCKEADRTALIQCGELRKHSRVSYAELNELVRRTANAMKAAGVQRGDRIAGYIANCVEAIVAMLAAASIGAIWSSTSPDFGTVGVLERFSQINPKILFSVNAVAYNGRFHDHLAKLKAVVEGLPELEKVVVIPFIEEKPCDVSEIRNAVTWDDFLNKGDDDPLTFEQLPFSHPLYILFSSGTTGKPKCLVHSAGGMLLQHKKEHQIHGDMGPDDVFFQYTTTGWMMWNWLVSGLAVGATLVLFDGSPFKPNAGALWDLIDELDVTLFGTSAKYIQSLQEADYHPNRHCKLTRFRGIYSTGSPLKPESFDYVYQSIKKDLVLGSITGGTDICSLFMGHNTMLPVYRGEIQCRCLGMKVEAWDGENKPVFGQSADLVCTRPFPCMPVYFWDDASRAKYLSAYFSVYPHVWYHGDFIWINPNTRGVVMLGRSDGTLNPSGVRFGSAEIYNVMDAFAQHVEDSLVVGQKWKDDERVILFLKMKQDFAGDFNTLVAEIRKKIRELLSPRHVPAKVLQIADIPYTINGKKIEVAVKKIISNQVESAAKLNTGAIGNPESLHLYENIPELQVD